MSNAPGQDRPVEVRARPGSQRELDAGGHFAAWERPEAYAAGVREALALA